ncbi:hypothetical protein [Telluria aromaticivorans]|uniref:Thioredoxin family protein n=1 Tax=Telluria aromaticivorans TaxID=2725995 RepID=A0A7Y2JVW6_9BURK|nr:hypothetical protein [Telluria aromaticivorans]NNG22005.1 hypothetical protein [Telluria aromaticivorans]
MNHPPIATRSTLISESSCILFHDGCRLCLDIAQTLELTIPGLTVIDLGAHPELKFEAVVRGIEQLPSLVVGSKVLTISPHSVIDHVGADAAHAPADIAS